MLTLCGSSPSQTVHATLMLCWAAYEHVNAFSAIYPATVTFCHANLV